MFRMIFFLNTWTRQDVLYLWIIRDAKSSAPANFTILDDFLNASKLVGWSTSLDYMANTERVEFGKSCWFLSSQHCRFLNYQDLIIMNSTEIGRVTEIMRYTCAKYFAWQVLNPYYFPSSERGRESPLTDSTHPSFSVENTIRSHDKSVVQN